jgi:hypothetical protein
MLFAAAGVLILALAALAFIGITDARLGVERLERELDASNGATELPFPMADEVDALDAARFSASLLCLSKAQQEVARNSPALVNDESSSLVLVRPAQSKSRAAVS